jgi:DNA-binding transcriptional LysR family regulator
VELSTLAWFRTVARLEHMTQAAEELGLTQSALSRAIGRLERELGVPLFDRQGRGLRLNRYGGAFLVRIDRMFRELDAATSEVRDLADPEQGSVSLAAGALHWLPELLRPFQAAHPAVRFRLWQRSLPELHRLLETGEVDYCFVPAPVASPAIGWHHLRSASVALLVPASHRLADRRHVALRELAMEELILGKPGDVLREVMEGYFRQAGIAPRVACEADEPGAIEDYVVAGLGVGLIPALHKPTADHAATRRIRLDEPDCTLTLGIAWNETRYLSAAARAFRPHVLAFYAAARPGDAPGAR